MALTCSYEEFLIRVDQESEDMTKDKEQLYQFVKQGYDQFDGPKSAELTWRLGRAIYKRAQVAEVAGDKKTCEKLTIEAENTVRKAVELDDSCAQAHVWMATVMGKHCDFLGAKERIAAGKTIQYHLDRAIAIQSEDYIAFYVYGRWCYDVASLTWVEKKIASALFGTPPDSSYADAMDKFRSAERLKPEWKANLYWIAKTAVSLKDYATAIQVADKAAAAPVVDEEDMVYVKDISDLQKKYTGYRSKSG